MAPVRVHIEVEGDGEDREEHDEQDPGDLDVGVPGPVDHDQGHNEARQHGPAVDGVVPEPVESRKEEAELGRQQEDHHRGPAEDQAEEAPPALVEQQDGLLVQMGPFLLCHGVPPVFR